MSTETTEKRKPGRKPGTKSPRDIKVTCISGKDLVVEEITVSGDKASQNSDLMAAAVKEWEKKHGKAPMKVLAPHFSRCGQQTYQKKRDSIRLPLDQVSFTKESALAEYNGWEVKVRYVENVDDAVYIFFKRQLVEDDKKHAKPAAKAVPISALKNLRPAE